MTITVRSKNHVADGILIRYFPSLRHVLISDSLAPNRPCLHVRSPAPHISTTYTNFPLPHEYNILAFTKFSQSPVKPYPLRSHNFALNSRLIQNVRSIELAAEDAQRGADRTERQRGLHWVRDLPQTLHSIADGLTFHRHDGMKKTELEVALDDYLTKNASQFSSDTQFAPFYKGRGGSSPVKKEASSAISDIETKVKSVKRRVTKAAEELVAT